jgi:glucose-1-phosphate adenylyltransferase
VRATQNVKITNKDGVDEKFDEAAGIYIRSGIVVVTKGATVPDGTAI